MADDQGLTGQGIVLGRCEIKHGIGDIVDSGELAIDRVLVRVNRGDVTAEFLNLGRPDDAGLIDAVRKTASTA